MLIGEVMFISSLSLSSAVSLLHNEDYKSEILRHMLMAKSSTRASNIAVWTPREDHTKIAYLLIFKLS